MNIIKIKYSNEIPKDYTGIVEWESGNKSWYKNGRSHREDGPAYIRKDGVIYWDLDGRAIWDSHAKLNLRNQIILSKSKHPKYPTVQVWKILGPNGLYEQVVIPGMEAGIIE